jgi:hypothetical protein
MPFRTRKPWRMCWMAVLCVLVLTAAAHPRTGRAAGSSRPAAGATDSAGTATYLDSSGDGGTAPDITSVVVSRDAERRINFRVNLAQPVRSAGRLAIAIDSDEDAATGYGGFDAMFVVDLASDDLVGAAGTVRASPPLHRRPRPRPRAATRAASPSRSTPPRSERRAGSPSSSARWPATGSPPAATTTHPTPASGATHSTGRRRRPSHSPPRTRSRRRRAPASASSP